MVAISRLISSKGRATATRTMSSLCRYSASRSGTAWPTSFTPVGCTTARTPNRSPAAGPLRIASLRPRRKSSAVASSSTSHAIKDRIFSTLGVRSPCRLTTGLSITSLGQGDESKPCRTGRVFLASRLWPLSVRPTSVPEGRRAVRHDSPPRLQVVDARGDGVPSRSGRVLLPDGTTSQRPRHSYRGRPETLGGPHRLPR